MHIPIGFFLSPMYFCSYKSFQIFCQRKITLFPPSSFQLDFWGQKQTSFDVSDNFYASCTSDGTNLFWFLVNPWMFFRYRYFLINCVVQKGTQCNFHQVLNECFIHMLIPIDNQVISPLVYFCEECNSYTYLPFLFKFVAGDKSDRCWLCLFPLSFLSLCVFLLGEQTLRTSAERTASTGCFSFTGPA